MGRSLSLFTLLVSTASAAKAAAPEPGNAVVDAVMGMVNDLVGAGLGLATDAADLVAGTPRFLVNVALFAANFVRGLPDLLTNVFNGDAATLDSLADFATSTATIVFATYAALAALNLLVKVTVDVKDSLKGYMTIPTAPFGIALPKPVKDVIAFLQKQINQVRDYKAPSWICPLGGQGGKSVTVSNVANSMSAATSACMILSCAPSVLALMRGGANKASAEAIAYTVGTALGLQYLNKLCA